MRHTLIAVTLLASVANCAFAQVASSDGATEAAAKSDKKVTTKAKLPSGKKKPPKTNEVSRSPDVRGADVNLAAPHTAKSTETVAPDKK